MPARPLTTAAPGDHRLSGFSVKWGWKESASFPFPSGPAWRVCAEDQVLDYIFVHAFSAQGKHAPKFSVNIVRQALERWCKNGLQFETSRSGHRLFDPAETINFMKWSNLVGKDDFWEKNAVPNGRALVGSLDGSSSIAASLERRRTYYPGEWLNTVRRVGIAIPVECGTLSELRATAEAPSNARLRIGRIDTGYNGAGACTIVGRSFFRAYPTQTSDGSQQELSDEELRRYLTLKEGLICSNPRIKSLAAELSDDRSSRHTVKRFWNYILDNLFLGSLYYSQLAPEDPLEQAMKTGWIDCLVGSAIFASLCRTAGIPARIVGGLTLYENCSFEHFWAEAFFGDTGWLPYDLQTWDLSRGGKDEFYRDFFFEKLEPRATTHILPHTVPGPAAQRWPSVWYLLQTNGASALETTCVDLLSNTPAWSESVTVQHLDRTP